MKRAKRPCDIRPAAYCDTEETTIEQCLWCLIGEVDGCITDIAVYLQNVSMPFKQAIELFSMLKHIKKCMVKDLLKWAQLAGPQWVKALEKNVELNKRVLEQRNDALRKLFFGDDKSGVYRR